MITVSYSCSTKSCYFDVTDRRERVYCLLTNFLNWYLGKLSRLKWNHFICQALCRVSSTWRLDGGGVPRGFLNSYSIFFQPENAFSFTFYNSELYFAKGETVTREFSTQTWQEYGKVRCEVRKCEEKVWPGEGPASYSYLVGSRISPAEKSQITLWVRLSSFRWQTLEDCKPIGFLLK